MKLLAGDVGGTKTVLALVEGGKLTRRTVYPSGKYSSLESMAQEFLGSGTTQINRACFGVAGPVRDDVCQATNLPWVIEGRTLERVLGATRVGLVNDFHALAVGITELSPSDFAVLNDAPSDPRGPWVVLGAGTGLGEAVVIKSGASYEIIASEGGHTDFAPRDELEIELLRFLLAKHQRVSYERVVSGPGLATLYEFMCARSPGRESAKVRQEIDGGADPAATVSTHALAGDDPLCAETLHLFVSLYGAEAGNLALKVVARGGVYVAGGIAPKILPKLLDGTFRASFLNKGRLSPVLESTPVKVVLNADAGLIGAAAIAGRMAL